MHSLLHASLQFIQMTEAPEKFIIRDDPAYEEGEQRHEPELADEADKWSDGLLEDCLDYLDVELGAHVDGVDDDHEDHDVHEQLVKGPVRHHHRHRLVVETAALVTELQNLHTQNVASELHILERGFSADKLSYDILRLLSMVATT